MSHPYLLDTNVCVRLLNRTHPGVMAHFRATPRSRLRLCSIVKSELWFGVHNSDTPVENRRRLQQFFSPLKSLPFDDECAEQAGLLRSELRRTGQPIGGPDLLIAATALAFDATLVTHNTREFSRIRGLRLEDWDS